MTWRALGRGLALGAGCLWAAGCLELVRRPAAASGAGRAAEAPTAATGPRRVREPGGGGDLRAVNEYVRWCMQQDLWNEAKLHLERALAQDSLAASLHNNLGIVYERLGEWDRATASYRRAGALNPGNRTYGRNLALLEQWQKTGTGEASGARPDTTVTRLLVPPAEADSSGPALQ